MTPQEKRQLDEVYEFIQSLKRSSSIPREIDQSFRERFINGIQTGSEIALSAKVNSSENQGVNEAGASTYSVLAVPDVFLEVEIGGVTYYLPAFT